MRRGGEPEAAVILISRRTKAILLGLACLAVLAGILVAGLWPFGAPANSAEWLPAGGGLWFGKYGTALSSGPFEKRGAQGGGFHTVEVWLDPWKPWNTSTILAFYSANHIIPFSLRQSARGLLVESREKEAGGRPATSKLRVARIFYSNHPVLIAITSNGRETEVYVNGALVAESGTHGFTSDNLKGELVIANSPVTEDSWSGVWRGLAFCDEVLTPQSALQDYQSWARDGHPAAGSTSLLYLFNQTGGRIIHAQNGRGPNLEIPPRYVVFHERFLRPFWDEFEFSRHYLKDVLINIAGFVPLGFFFFAFFSSVWPRRRSALITVCCGAAVSITIEVLQAYLPTRDSGMTDIITNTLGTAIGAGLYSCAWILLQRAARRPQASRLTRSIAGSRSAR